MTFIYSCKKEVKSTYNSMDLSLQLDTISIPIDSTFIQFYQITNYNKEQKRLYAYNPLLHRIDYMSFKDKSIGFIKLESEGPNAIEKPRDFYVDNENSIFLIGISHFTKLDFRGNIDLKNRINDISVDKFYSKYFIAPEQDNSFEYSSYDNMFYILNANMSISKRENPQKFYKSFQVLSKYDFNDNKVYPIEINYPKEFTVKDFGYNNMPFFTLDKDKIYYSFSPMAEIFEYNLTEEKVNEKKSEIKDLPIYKNDYNNLSSTFKGLDFKTFTNNSNFGTIKVLDDFIIRIYMSGTPDSKIGLNDNKLYKKTALQIFDKNLNTIKNITIENEITFYGIFSDNDHLYIQIEALKENEVRFIKIRIVKNS